MRTRRLRSLCDDFELYERLVPRDEAMQRAVVYEMDHELRSLRAQVEPEPEEEGMGIEHYSLKPYVALGVIVTVVALYLILVIARVIQ